jgi:hypothetical protein
VFCACERWGILPETFGRMTYPEQIELLAWENLRAREASVEE